MLVYIILYNFHKLFLSVVVLMVAYASITIQFMRNAGSHWSTAQLIFIRPIRRRAE